MPQAVRRLGKVQDKCRALIGYTVSRRRLANACHVLLGGQLTHSVPNMQHATGVDSSVECQSRSCRLQRQTEYGKTECVFGSTVIRVRSTLRPHRRRTSSGPVTNYVERPTAPLHSKRVARSATKPGELTVSFLPDLATHSLTPMTFSNSKWQQCESKKLTKKNQ